MLGTVLAVLDGPEAAPAVLAAAARLAGLIGATATALAIRIPAAATILPSEEVLTERHKAAWDAAEQQRLAALREAQRASEVAVLHIVEGDPAAMLTEAAAAAAMLVLSRPADAAPADAPAILHAALFHSGRPVLLVPPGAAAPFGHQVAIAWKADGRADKAILAALPVLRQAGRVRLLAGQAEPPGLPQPLHDAAIRAELCALPPDPPGGLGAALLAAAQTAGDDLLVMGAYGHSRFREMVLGGVTRHVLAAAEIPVLLCH